MTLTHTSQSSSFVQQNDRYVSSHPLTLKDFDTFIVKVEVETGAAKGGKGSGRGISGKKKNQ